MTKIEEISAEINEKIQNSRHGDYSQFIQQILESHMSEVSVCINMHVDTDLDDMDDMDYYELEKHHKLEAVNHLSGQLIKNGAVKSTSISKAYRHVNRYSITALK